MKTTTLSTNPIAAAILLAFSDCHGSDSEMQRGMSTRNLSFRAPGPLHVSDAMAVMAEAVPSGYNEFHADTLALLPADAQVTIAREGSVAVYVKGNVFAIAEANYYSYSTNAHEQAKLKADEISYDAANDTTRIWWD